MTCRSSTICLEESSIIKTQFQKLIPRLSSLSYKGSSGKIGIIGGSPEYTGAPYFAAMSALRCGADLSAVFCHPSAAIPIKSYGPDIIVHPILSPTKQGIPEQDLRSLLMMHAFVIGPGLGRDPDTLNYTATIIQALRQEGKPMVLDGDGLYLLAQQPTLLGNFNQAILTPNAREFERLWKAVMKSDPPDLDSCPSAHLLEREPLKEVNADMDPYVQDTVLLARQFPGCVLVRKGSFDIISDGSETVWICNWKGSDRRVSGQGDLLAGIAVVLLNWAKTSAGADLQLSVSKAAVIACVTVREAARLGFLKHGRSLITSDILVCLGSAFQMFQP